MEGSGYFGTAETRLVQQGRIGTKVSLFSQERVDQLVAVISEGKDCNWMEELTLVFKRSWDEQEREKSRVYELKRV